MIGIRPIVSRKKCKGQVLTFQTQLIKNVPESGSRWFLSAIPQVCLEPWINFGAQLFWLKEKEKNRRMIISLYLHHTIWHSGLYLKSAKNAKKRSWNYFLKFFWTEQPEVASRVMKIFQKTLISAFEHLKCGWILRYLFRETNHCTMNIFGSKSGHKNTR